MVLQSILQFREFGREEHLARYRAHHEQLVARQHGNEKDAEPVPSPATSTPISNTANNSADGTEPHGSQAGVRASGDGEGSSVARQDGSHGNHDENKLGPHRSRSEQTAERQPASSATEAKEGQEVFLVGWEDADGTANPRRWHATRKWVLVFFITQLGFVVGATSSIDSAADQQAAALFGVGREVMALQTAVFLVGFGLAAPFLGSLSELGGRVPVYVITLLLFVLFEIGSGLASNIQTRVILRFFAGFFGSTPLSNSGGSLADVFDARERTLVFPIFANAGFLGPVLGPTIGGYLAMNVGQEWCDYLMAIYGAALLVAVILFMPETYAPTLLKMKVIHIRKVTQDERYKTQLEVRRIEVPFRTHIKHVFALPFLYLTHEPIVLCLSLYMSVIYIILFGYFESIPLVFQPFGLNDGEIGLTFIAVAIGLFVTTSLTPWLYQRYLRLTRNVQEQRRADGDKDWQQALPAPEERLLVAMILTWCIPIGLFYQAWTSFPSLPVWPCISAGIVVGAGLLACFISSYQYIIDVYKEGSATALGALTFTRYLISGGTVMFTEPMFLSLGNRWALSLLAFLSLVFCFIPWIFFFFGKRIRQSSPYTPQPDD